MEKKYKILVFLFAFITIISLAGFYTSYLSVLPDFKQFRFVIHIHFVAFLCWFILIISQPILIKQRKFALHRKLGILSYFLAPVLLITILILVYQQVQREIVLPENSAHVTALIGLLDAVSFAAYYIVAMVNKRNIRWHVAFIIAATLIVFNPGMARLLNQIEPGLGLPGAVLFPFMIALIIILIEKIKWKRPVLKSPYFLFLCLWILEIVILISLPGTTFWKNAVTNFMMPG